MQDNYFEYDPLNPDSWVPKLPPTKPDWFDAELTEISGLNRYGNPNLKLVWGGTELSDRTEKSRLKYHAGYSPKEVKGWRYRDGDEWVFSENVDHVPSTVMLYPDIGQEQLGMTRWIIERWVSPEELERQRRFKTRKYFKDVENVLREFPRDGIYDCYFVIENSQGRFRQLDRDVITFLKMKWYYDQRPNEVEDMITAHEDKEFDSEQKREAELWYAAKGFDLKLPIEERERREEYWAKHHDYVYAAARAREQC